MAGHGVRQFLDVGSGLPTSPIRTPGAEPLWRATHESARAVMPDAIVAYHMSIGRARAAATPSRMKAR